MDTVRDDPEYIKRVDRTVDTAINHCADYFGEDSLIKRKSPVVCLEEGKEKVVAETAAARHRTDKSPIGKELRKESSRPAA